VSKSTCEHDGYFVDSDHPMMSPSDLAVTAAEVTAKGPIGCANIVCSRCHAVVVQRPNAIFVRPWPAGRKVRDVYDAGDLDVVTEPRPDLRHRACLCRCSFETALGAASFEALREEQGHPWSCGGHDP
jgi:hypothetical protein